MEGHPLLPIFLSGDLFEGNTPRAGTKIMCVSGFLSIRISKFSWGDKRGNKRINGERESPRLFTYAQVTWETHWYLTPLSHSTTLTDELILHCDTQNVHRKLNV